MLNRGGVAAGRYVPGHLLLHWFGAVHSAVLAELGRYTGEAWTRAGLLPGASHGVGALAQRVGTVPGQPAFTHAAIHLRQLSAVVPAAR